MCINGALPDGRASAPHYDPTASNTQLPQHPFFVETKMALPGSICSVQVRKIG